MANQAHYLRKKGNERLELIENVEYIESLVYRGLSEEDLIHIISVIEEGESRLKHAKSQFKLLLIEKMQSRKGI